jgi:hypothetical protein
MARKTHRRSEFSLAYGMTIVKKLGELSLLGGFYLHGHYAELYFEKTRNIAWPIMPNLKKYIVQYVAPETLSSTIIHEKLRCPVIASECLEECLPNRKRGCGSCGAAIINSLTVA